MDITSRIPTADERRNAVSGVSIFEPRLRRLAKQEAASGCIEVLTFCASAAWNIITCPGPPCCPNTWLLKTTQDEYVWVESWHDLTAERDQFPGTHVTIERWAESHRILSAKASGTPIKTHDGTDIDHLNPATEVEVYASGALPDEIMRAIGSL